MKRIFVFLLVAVLGGLVALGGAQLLGLNKEVRYVEREAQPSAQYARFADPARTAAPRPVPQEGFTTAAERALPGVVHIKASKRSNGMAGNFRRGGGQMPFGIDPDDLPEAFRDLFGNPGQGGEEGDEGRRQMPLQQGSGSGVIISDDGYIVTNNHVVEDAENLEVVLNDQRTYEATLIGTDPTTDIALIKIAETGLSTVKFADSDQVKVGEWVVAVGNPFSLTNTVTAGIVSAKGRSIDLVQRSGGRYAIESFIQTDAVVNPGNSGGALVNTNGDLIGINTAISSPTGVFAGYSFAVPSAIVKKVAEDLREYGVVQRGLLGASIINLNTATAKELGLTRDNGVYVNEVLPNSAAEEAGIEKGDVILAVNGVRTLRNSTLLEQLGRRRPGDRVTITIERDGDREDVDVQLRNAQGNTDVVTAAVASVASLPDFGIDVNEVDPATAEDLGVGGGIVVTTLKEGLVSDQTRIREGFIVTKVNGRTVRKTEDFVTAIENSRGTIILEGIYPAEPERRREFAIVR